MSLNVIEGTVIDPKMEEARRMTAEKNQKDIQRASELGADYLNKLRSHIKYAKEYNLHEPLGYTSLADYLKDSLHEKFLDLAGEKRGEVIGLLSTEGLSTRAIESITGIPKSTVSRELSQSGTPEQDERTIIGTDGKSYTIQPSTMKVEKKYPDPLNTRMDKKFDDIGRIVTKLERDMNDPNFKSYLSLVRDKNKESVQRYIKTLKAAAGMEYLN